MTDEHPENPKWMFRQPRRRWLKLIEQQPGDGEESIAPSELEQELNALEEDVQSRWPADLELGGEEAINELRRRIDV
jgi:hypothetical protein